MAFVSAPVQNLGNGRSIRLSQKLSRRPKHRIVMAMDRRTCLQNIALASLAISLNPSLAKAAVYASDTQSSFSPKGDPKKLSTYMPQIEAGYQALVDLNDDWVSKTKDYDGDVVRRVLGTVGVKSPLFNIRKSFLKSWQIIAESGADEDFIERIESEWNDVLNGIASIDFQLYSVSFTELRESKESLITQGKKALEETIVIYYNLLKDLRSV